MDATIINEVLELPKVRNLVFEDKLRDTDLE